MRGKTTLTKPRKTIAIENAQMLHILMLSETDFKIIMFIIFKERQVKGTGKYK